MSCNKSHPIYDHFKKYSGVLLFQNFKGQATAQAPVVQRVDNAIQRISIGKTNYAIRWIVLSTLRTTGAWTQVLKIPPFLRVNIALEIVSIDCADNSNIERWRGGNFPGGYSPTIPIRVCGAQRGRDFRATDLERGITFRTYESSSNYQQLFEIIH